MKKIALSIILVLGIATIFTACERNDYQHPGYRNSHK
jgi:predicted small secreted protein